MDNICKFSCLCFLYVATGNLQTLTLHKGNPYIERLNQIRPIDYRTFSINRSVNFHQLPTVKTVLIYKAKTPVFLSAASLPLLFFNKKISTPKKTRYPHGPAFFYGANTRNILEFMNHPSQSSIPKVVSTKLVTKFTPTVEQIRSPKTMDNLNIKLFMCKATDGSAYTFESRELCISSTKTESFSNIQDTKSTANYISNQQALPMTSTISGQDKIGSKWNESKQNKTNFSFPHSGQSFFTLDDVVVPSTTESKQQFYYSNTAPLSVEHSKKHNSTVPMNQYFSKTTLPVENSITDKAVIKNFNATVQTTQRHFDSYSSETSTTTTLPNVTTTPLTKATVNYEPTTTKFNNKSSLILIDEGIQIVPQTSTIVMISNENVENNRVKQKLKKPSGKSSANLSKLSALHNKKILLNTIEKINPFKIENFIRPKLLPTKRTTNNDANISTTSSEKNNTVDKNRIIQSKYRKIRPTLAKSKLLIRSTDNINVNITLTSNKRTFIQKPPKRLFKRTQTNHVSTDDRKENQVKEFETQKVVTTTAQTSRTNNMKICLESAIMTIASNFENNPRNISSTTKNRQKSSYNLAGGSVSNITEIPQLPIEIFFRKRDKARNNF